MTTATQSMTTYSAGDLLLLQFPQTGGAQGVVRPALLLIDDGDLDVVVARVTRQMHGTAYDIVLTDWKGAGLRAPSVVRLHKIATLEKKLIQQRLGALQPQDRSAIATALAQVFAAW